MKRIMTLVSLTDTSFRNTVHTQWAHPNVFDKHSFTHQNNVQLGYINLEYCCRSTVVGWLV